MKKPFENIVGREENTINQHSLLLVYCFLSIYRYVQGHLFEPHLFNPLPVDKF